ncbi:MAG: NTPase [Candidatus Nezhaarchaeota archaeon]|nr:NTPase [Candidatus Nezhaarchaeota archaeon]MCX8142238.1 NTPase [Candidatus Nezhaarchaeota archaeon]
MFVTGRPGIGKTTLVFKVVDQLRSLGFKVGGIVTLEVRKGGVRSGFKIVDVESGEETSLATVSSAPGPRVGKYLVHVENIDTFAVNSVIKALESGDLVVIDEIGPMELKSQKFVEAVKRVLASKKPLLATLHYRLRHPLLNYIRSHRDYEVIEITESNRDHLVTRIIEKIRFTVTRRES